MRTAISVLTVLVLALVLMFVSTAFRSTGARPVASSLPAALAEDGESASAASKLAISDVMVVANAGPDSLSGQVRGLLKGTGPEDEKAWKRVSARAQVLATLAGLLKKQKPEKGSAESWTAQTTSYGAGLKKLAAAAKAMDLAATQAAAKAVGGLCKGCHESHK